MNQSGKKSMVRTTVDIDFELKEAIHAMAQEKKWSFSYMSYVLLQQSVREKLRKRKNVIKDKNKEGNI